MKLWFIKFLLIFSVLVSMCDAVNFLNVPEKAIYSNHRHERSVNKIERSKPQKYLTILLSSIESNRDLNRSHGNDGTGSSNGKSSGQRERLFFTWMPTEIKETSLNKTTLMFQSFSRARAFLTDFTGSIIVLTLRDDFQHENDIQIRMRVFLANNNMSMLENDSSHNQTQLIVAEKKFYIFDICKFLASFLQNDSSHEAMNINIIFEVKSTQEEVRTIDFKSVFDLQDESPFITIFYHNFLPNEVTLIESKQQSRIKREAVNGRPLYQCQRREFYVNAHEIYWLNLVFPLKLDLGYCSGACPSPLQDQYYNMTLHSFLLDRYRMMSMFNAPKDFPHSHCIPVSYKSITVLEQIGANQFEASVERDISVASCGCRY